MIISGINKLTLLDYPKHIACIIFTQGCGLKCPFCQNSPLIKNSDDKVIDEEDVIEYLNKRKKVLDGLVISGGEPTMQKDLKEFIKKVKNLGLKVKLDTNGFSPHIVKDLLDEDLLDYVALDIKNDIEHYGLSCGIKNIKPDKVLETIDILRNSNIDYEFRTTIMKDYHNIINLKNIIKLIPKESKYYLQNFKDSENVIDHTIKGFSDEELNDFLKILKKDHENIEIR